MSDKKNNNDDVGAVSFGWNVFKYGSMLALACFGIWLVLFSLNLISAPGRMMGGVATRVIDADHALQSYRWFHSANQGIKAKVSQIKLSKGALEAASEDRKEARRVELLGLQQGCQTLVSQYNEKATRVDTVIFMNPEKFLPGDWPAQGENKLPLTHDLNICV